MPNTNEAKTDQKKRVEELRGEWQQLWRDRYDDQIRAEGVSAANYTKLQVERGTIIHATRDYKPLNFKEILQQNQIENPDRYIPPNSQIGGWNKFVKTQITQPKQPHTKPPPPPKKANQQPKKGGRGWLHTT